MRFVRKPTGRLLDLAVDAMISLSGTRVGQHVRPPILARRFLRIPRTPLDRLTRLQHRNEQVRYVRPAAVEKHEVKHAPRPGANRGDLGPRRPPPQNADARQDDIGAKGCAQTTSGSDAATVPLRRRPLVLGNSDPITIQRSLVEVGRHLRTNPGGHLVAMV